MKLSTISFIFISVCILTACGNEPKLTPLSSEASILAFGDSLTYGTGTSKENAYPAKLSQLSERTVINAGIPGETSAEGLQRLPALLIKHQPELIIICHGANDILRKLDLEKTRINLQRMINTSREHGTQVILVAVPAFSLFLSPHEMYLQLAEKNNIPIEANSLSSILGNNQLKSDQIHPNKQGYKQFAEAIYNTIRENNGL